MTDRELLERAARAADVFVVNGAPIEPCSRMPSGWRIWNPLENNGDAFRLMVDLELNVFQAAAKSWAVYEFNETSIEGDPLTATRRAIVLATVQKHKNDHNF